MSRRYASRRHAGGLDPSRVRTRIPTTRRLGLWVSLRKILRFRVRLQLSQSRCLSLLLAMSGRVFPFFPPCGHEPPPISVPASTQTSAFNAIVFQSPVMPNARMSLCTQSVHSFSFLNAIGTQLRDSINSGLTRWRMAIINEQMDATAELGRNPVGKHQIQPEYGNEQAYAGRDCRTRLARPNSQARTRTGKYYFFLFS